MHKGLRAIMVKLVGYIRVSSESQEENTSLPLQKQQIENYCLNHGHELVEVFTEVKSGKSINSRPIFNQALAVAATSADGIICTRLDRFGRDTIDTLTLVRDFIRPNKKALILIDDGIDTTKDESDFILTVKAGIATDERRIISKRTKSGKAAKAAKGGYIGGQPQFGMKSVQAELAPNEDELKIVEIIRRHRKSGKSYQKIADYLNQNSYQTKENKQWYAASVSNVYKRLYPSLYPIKVSDKK
jgi:DNA invertase Pin-like site-specific DNA recombinase